MSKKPNVLILFTDQQRQDTVNFAGNKHMITPNLDRLAAEGCTYTNAYSSNPVCMPARHDLITGLSGRAHGYFNNNKVPIKDYSIPTLPRVFSENGYRTAAIGKMHFCPARMHHGFSEMYLMEEIPVRRQDDHYAKFLQDEGLAHLQNIHGIRPHIYHVPQNAQMDEKHHGSTWVADRTVEWMEENGNQPFFVMAGWIHPHPPWDIPKEMQGIYSDVELPEPAPISRLCGDIEGPGEWYGDEMEPEEMKKVREAYYTAVTLVDKNIGRVIEYLREKGQLDNTLIIFTSDHGEMLGDKGYWSKCTPYDGSAKVPFIVRYPEKFAAGEFKKEFIDTFDIFPTCLDFCGLTYPESRYALAGESIGAEQPERDRKHAVSSHAEGAQRWVMYRNERYKYVYNYYQGIEELYDMVQDPGEVTNLMTTGEYPKEVYLELKKGAIEYEKQWGPEGMILNNDFIALQLPKNQKFRIQSRKHHFWANSQFQRFDEREPQVRGDQYIREIEYAVSDKEVSGRTLNEVYNHPDWKKNFRANWEKFGAGEEVFKRLFKE